MRFRLHLTRQNGFWILAMLAILTFIPYLGEALFSTKGEPREAIVAVSMLDSGNWILPVSNGDIMPYKPPMLAWCIAVVSLVVGHVTEFSSRLPSALSLIIMLLWGFRFYSRRAGQMRAFIAGMVTFTAFEVFRAGYACRVDMLLTMFMVGALYSLYDYWERGLRGIPWIAVLMMSGACLTKGPVGVFLPCLCAGVFMLFQKVRWTEAVWKLVCLGVMSLIIPAIWYVLAYMQGGEKFLDLAMEENVGRMTGSMSYESHENPFWYNFITVIAGYAPYTLLLLLSLVPWGKVNALMPPRIKKWWTGFRAMPPVEQFSLLCTLMIFIFYCIPKSKRSVYLLPIYPFLAFFIARFAMYLVHIKHRSIKIYAGIISAVAIIAYATFVVVQCGWFPFGILKGKHALEQSMMVTNLGYHLSWILWIVVSLSVISGAIMIVRLKKLTYRSTLLGTLLTTVLIYWAFAGVYQPRIMNAKSDKPIAEFLNRTNPEGPIYSYIDTDQMRFFTTNFYAGDRIRPIELDDPDSGLMLVGVRQAKEWLPKNADRYEFTLVKHFKARSCDMRDQILLLHFQKK
ncbi:MAG: glycosyltransferase family 39 protein [Muribaculum sp.]|nr:glycosyltransferase family 39 protein [Muribaculum sp.]